MELEFLLSVLFGRTVALGRGAVGGQVRHSSGDERSRSGVYARRAWMAGHVSGIVRIGSPWLTHSSEGTGEGEREEEEVGRVATLEDGEGRVFCRRRGLRTVGAAEGDGGVTDGVVGPSCPAEGARGPAE